MSNNRDAISKMAQFDDLADITVTTASPVVVKSASVDTNGMYGLGFVVKGDRVLVGGGADDAILYSFEDSDDDSVFTAVVDEASLPARKQVPDNNLVVAVAPFLQTVGVFSTKRYVKLVVSGQPASSDYVITPRPFALSELKEFTGYDPVVVPGDGLA